MTRTRKDQRRDRAERAVDSLLARLARDPDREPWLPMPCPTRARLSKLTYEEWYEYRRRRALHAAEHPAYESAFHRPTAETADDVWHLLRLEGVDDFLPPFAYTDEQKDAAHLVVMQATVILLDTLVRAGRRDQPNGEPDDRRLVTRNVIFDAVAGRWSDHCRLARAEDRAHHVGDMTIATAVASWRDLMRAGVPLARLWPFVKHLTRLYTLKLVKRREGRRLLRLGYGVILHDSPLLERFERLVNDDPVYRPRWREDEERMLFDGDVMPERRLQQEICAERPYDVVPLGPRAERLLETLERTRLVFETDDFLKDYDDPPNAGWLAQYRRIFEQVRAGVPPYVEENGERIRNGPGFEDWLTGATLIKAQHFRALNGRWHAGHFWPTEVGRRLTHVFRFTDEYDGQEGIWHDSDRGQWFAYRPGPSEVRVGEETYSRIGPPTLHSLYGFDVSGSQTQILAVLLGASELERRASTPDVPFKQYLASVARDQFDLVGYEQNPKQLVALVKDLWMRVMYGSTVRRVVRDVLKDPETYGPGLAPRMGDRAVDREENRKRAELFLAAIPCIDAVRQFLAACRAIPA